MSGIRRKRETVDTFGIEQDDEKEAQKGAESIGDENEYIDMYDLNYNGCRSCMACKRKGIEEPCKCYWKDGLSPILEKIWKADRLITGAPIYYSQPSGGFRSFLERITFPAMSYNDYSSVFKGKVDVDVFLTMNTPLNGYDQMYKAKMDEYFGPFRFLNGNVRLIPVCDTLQVKDYSKYEMGSFSDEHKKAFQKRHSMIRTSLKSWNLPLRSVIERHEDEEKRSK